MPVLTKKQLDEGYFEKAGGFPSLSQNPIDRTNFAHEVNEYNGQKQLCISCTQLCSAALFKDQKVYSVREQKRILNEWVEFLCTNTKTFKALHFSSHVPQKLFDAACCQENLEELRFKWGNYKNLSALENLKKLKFLYLGSCPSVQNISPLLKLSNLTVLFIENFKRIEDYSPLAALSQLEQLVICGPILGNTPIKDYEFLRKMQNLKSVWFPNTVIRKKYTSDELEALQLALPNITFMYDSFPKSKT